MNECSEIHRHWKSTLLMLLVFLAPAIGSMAESKSIPPESVDDQKIFWGMASKFEKPGSVDYVALVTAPLNTSKRKK